MSKGPQSHRPFSQHQPAVAVPKTPKSSAAVQSQIVVLGLGGCGANVVQSLDCLTSIRVSLAIVDATSEHCRFCPDTIEVVKVDPSQSLEPNCDSVWRATLQPLMRHRAQVVILAGLGGLVGTWGSLAAAWLATEQGQKLSAVLVLPFGFELREHRSAIPDVLHQLEALGVDVAITDNEASFHHPQNQSGSVDAAFALANQSLRLAVSQRCEAFRPENSLASTMSSSTSSKGSVMESQQVSPRDSEASTRFLLALEEAWLACLNDYGKRLINSEHTLQASLYMHLRQRLEQLDPTHSFQVFAEAVVSISANDRAKQTKKLISVDLLVLHGKEVIGAIEIKYTPRKHPTVKSIRKDLTSLSAVTNRRSKSDQVFLEMGRFLNVEPELQPIKISPARKLVFAAITRKLPGSAQDVSSAECWSSCKPDSGYWENKDIQPTNLCYLFGVTKTDGTVEPKMEGAPLRRLVRN